MSFVGHRHRIFIYQNHKIEAQKWIRVSKKQPLRPPSDLAIGHNAQGHCSCLAHMYPVTCRSSHASYVCPDFKFVLRVPTSGSRAPALSRIMKFGKNKQDIKSSQLEKISHPHLSWVDNRLVILVCELITLRCRTDLRLKSSFADISNYHVLF
jgi:hypothetical protein